MNQPRPPQVIARWVVGGALTSAGAGYIAWMLYQLVLMRLHLVGAWDVAETFWWPMACVTFPLATVAIIAGWRQLRWRAPDVEPGNSIDGGA